MTAPQNAQTTVRAPVPATGEHALAVARALAAEIEPGAAERDRHRLPPLDALAAVADSGLLGISIPVAAGGPGLSRRTVVEVFRTLARADSAVAQLLLSHFVVLEGLRGVDLPGPRRVVADALSGAQIGNATVERGTKRSIERHTRVEKDGDGVWRLTGRKYYATGALGARWICVAATDAAGAPHTVFVEAGSPGLELALEDWSSFGQRATFSGTVILDGVAVDDELVLPDGPQPDPAPPSLFQPYDQILHAAIDVGIARAALEDGAAFVRDRSRPWWESGLDRAGDEPHVLRRFGELTARLHALEALLVRAADAIDAGLAERPLTAPAATAAGLAVADVKALAQEFAVEIASGVFELAGTSATDEGHGLDRHWRNVRVHTLHDPARWKYVHIGNHTVNGVVPPPGRGI